MKERWESRNEGGRKKGRKKKKGESKGEKKKGKNKEKIDERMKKKMREEREGKIKKKNIRNETILNNKTKPSHKNKLFPSSSFQATRG